MELTNDPKLRNEMAISALQQIEEAEDSGQANGQSLQSYNAGERVIWLQRTELLLVKQLLIAEVKENNEVIGQQQQES